MIPLWVSVVMQVSRIGLYVPTILFNLPERQFIYLKQDSYKVPYYCQPFAGTGTSKGYEIVMPTTTWRDLKHTPYFQSDAGQPYTDHN
jgi:hypothetical protein